MTAAPADLSVVIEPGKEVWMAGTWIEFRLAEQQAPKTHVWDVVTKDDALVIGQVRWWGRWRKYAFFPADGTLYEPTCLREIATFIEAQMAARKAARG